MRSHTTVLFLVRGAIIALLFMIAAGLLYGPAGIAPEPRSAEATSLNEVRKLLASDAQAEDFFGWSAAVSGDTAVVGAWTEDAGGSNAGAAYVFQRDQGGPGNWGEVKKLTASDAQAGDWFGHSVAISGNTAVVGAMKEDAGGNNAGAAYVFQREEGGANNWGEMKKLTASDAQPDDHFGFSVAVSGDTVVVGAVFGEGAGIEAGDAYIFQRDQDGQDNWGEVAKLTPSDAGAAGRFGNSVAISGDIAFVGAHAEDDWAGAAYVFRRDQGGVNNWGEVKKVTASDAEALDQFGWSVAVSGETAVVGAVWEDAAGSQAGAAYVFGRDQGGSDNWGEMKKLTASDAQADGWFGHSVAVNGNTVVVGAVGEFFLGSDVGAAYVFGRDQGSQDNWGEVAKLTASVAAGGDAFGYSVAVSGDTAVVGAYQEDAGGQDAGAVYVFEVQESVETVLQSEFRKLLASDGQTGAGFGQSVAVSGDTAIVGAPSQTAEGFCCDDFGYGAVFIFQRDQGGPDNWGEVARLTASDTEALDFFGISVAISGDTAVVGASDEDTGGNSAGAAYTFQRNQGGADNWGEVKKLTASDAEADDVFGGSVAVSGETIIVGAKGEDGGGFVNAGAAYVFKREEGGADNWGEVTKLTASDAQDFAGFGSGVAISGDTVVVGARGDSAGGSFAGAAYVFQRSQGGADNWGEVTKLTASDTQAGGDFGDSVTTSGDTIIVGASGLFPNAGIAGAAYVFQRDHGGTDNWGEITKLKASDAQTDDYFGWSVAVSGDAAIVGAWQEDDGGEDAGAAYVFQRDQGGQDNWGEAKKLTASDAQADDFFGWSVAASGGTAIVGAWGEGGAGGLQDGAAYVFDLLGAKSTPTSTPPTATETDTPTNTPTDTPTRTPVLTSTPVPTSTPDVAAGDASCDGTVNAVDAALILQFSAGLLNSIACASAADVNGDGTIDALDAALILQLAAGLVESLPP